MERTIFHIDVNSAFLSWEAVKRLEEGDTLDLRTVPSAVCGDASKRHGIILARSIPAGKLGVRTAEPTVDALRKCPELILVPATYGLYSKCSKAFISIVKEYTPIIEQMSVDETFADMTGCFDEDKGAVRFANEIRERIYNELGFTVNIGISDVKVLAKMASDFEKPNKVHTLYQREIKEKMWPLDVGALMFVGKASAAKLKTLGIRTIGELAQCPFDILKLHFGKAAQTMYEYANGIDDSEVETEYGEAKSVGNSTTMDHDVVDAEEAKNILLSLCESVGSRLRRYEFYAGNISVTIKSNTLKSVSHQKVCENSTNVTAELYEYVCSLFDDLWDGRTPIRLLGVSATSLTHEQTRQFSLFDTKDYQKEEKADRLMDELRSKFGKDIVTRASLIKKREEE